MMNTLNSPCDEINRGIQSFPCFRLDFIQLHRSSKIFLDVQCSTTNAALAGLQHWNGLVSFCFASLHLLVRNTYMENRTVN